MRTFSALFACFACLLLTCSGSDSEPPIVQITYPLTNSLVGGTVDVTIQAADNEAVASVELLLDEVLVATLTDMPYAYSWSTETLANYSQHALVARAFDTDENESAPDTVNVEVFNDTSGVSIFIWLFDPLDRFYDVGAGDSINCAYWLEQTILANGYTPETGTSLPAALVDYQAIFVTLGWFRGC